MGCFSPNAAWPRPPLFNHTMVSSTKAYYPVLPIARSKISTRTDEKILYGFTSCFFWLPGPEGRQDLAMVRTDGPFLSNIRCCWGPWKKHQRQTCYGVTNCHPAGHMLFQAFRAESFVHLVWWRFAVVLQNTRCRERSGAVFKISWGPVFSRAGWEWCRWKHMKPPTNKLGSNGFREHGSSGKWNSFAGSNNSGC